MVQLWQCLARFSAPWFSAWAGPALNAWQTYLVRNVRQWWHELASMPRTLIHNDFNSRNIALTRGEETRAVVLDWELARVWVPQHDLAELLCFTLPEEAVRSDVDRWIERHRERLSAHAQAP